MAVFVVVKHRKRGESVGPTLRKPFHLAAKNIDDMKPLTRANGNLVLSVPVEVNFPHCRRCIGFDFNRPHFSAVLLGHDPVFLPHKFHLLTGSMVARIPQNAGTHYCGGFDRREGHRGGSITSIDRLSFNAPNQSTVHQCLTRSGFAIADSGKIKLSRDLAGFRAVSRHLRPRGFSFLGRNVPNAVLPRSQALHGCRRITPSVCT